jgi:rare lipoprotein A
MKQIYLLAVLTLSALSLFSQDTALDSFYVQEGVASFYAKRFHGRPTASGEIFHVDSLTAAHKTLPFGTLVKVINLSNNNEVIVKINDRGMKGLKRIIDLSPAAARELDMVNKGLQKVRIEELRE